MTSRKDTVERIRRALAPLYDEREALQIARMVATELGGITLTQLLTEPDQALTIDRLDTRIAELAAGRPVQYVLGHTEFYGLELLVREGALIPRPETEELIRWIVDSPHPEAPAVLDIGTGSGCIALALARELPGAQVTAVDLSEEALAIARENARRHAAAIDFRREDALGDLLPGAAECFDLIVSNPPYVPQSERALMRDNVLHYEPAAALFVPDDDPLRFYRAIARHARRLLRPGGRLYFEIHENYARQMGDMLAEEGFPQSVVRRDLNDKNRMTCSLNIPA